MEPRFVFDSSKSANNALKHGIDFVRAQELWVDENRVEIEARTEGERRWERFDAMKAEDFDRLFDEGNVDLDEHLDLSTARRPGREVRRVNVDFPVWMIDALDHEATRLGITRQSVIKTWIAERLDRVGLSMAPETTSDSELPIRG